jgi:hypothetical protein
MYLTRFPRPLMALAVIASIACSSTHVLAGPYADFLATLQPTHHYSLDETTVGTAADTGTAAVKIDGTHAGDFGADQGEVGVAGPPQATGFEPGNLAFGANDWASVDLGPGSEFANSVMTVSTWFRVGTGFPGGSDGGDRIWTNNQSDGNVSFQLTLGGGANLVVGLNPAINGFPAAGLPSGDTVGNFQLTDQTVSIKDETWHHVVASRNGNNIEDVIIVVDGVNYPVDTWSDSTDTWGTTSTNAQIATRTPGNGGPSQHVLNGPTDEVSIWLGRQLSVEESIGLYCAANPEGDSCGGGGDFDNDGDVDGQDFLTWQTDDGTPGGLAEWQGAYPLVPPAAASSVPEPAALSLIVMSLLGITVRRSR